MEGGCVHIFDSYRLFLFSDVNDAFFSFLIVPDLFSEFFKNFYFLHVECVGGVSLFKCSIEHLM